MNTALYVQIDALLAALAQPLSADEVADGWTPEAKDATHRLLLELKDKVGTSQLPQQLSLSRALDHWGVVGGVLLERIAELSNQLRMHSQSVSAHR